MIHNFPDDIYAGLVGNARNVYAILDQRVGNENGRSAVGSGRQ